MCIESISHVLLGTNDAGTIRDAQKIFNNLKIMYELAILQNVTPYAVTIPERKHVCYEDPTGVKAPTIQNTRCAPCVLL